MLTSTARYNGTDHWLLRHDKYQSELRVPECFCQLSDAVCEVFLLIDVYRKYFSEGSERNSLRLIRRWTATDFIAVYSIRLFSNTCTTHHGLTSGPFFLTAADENKRLLNLSLSPQGAIRGLADSSSPIPFLGISFHSA